MTSSGKSEKIAIIGMSGVFPGCSSLGDFWQANLQGSSLLGRIKKPDWCLSGEHVAGPGGALDTMTHDVGFFLDHPALNDSDALSQSHSLVRWLADDVLDQVQGGYLPDRTGMVMGQLVLPSSGSSLLYESWLAGRPLDGLCHEYGMASDPVTSVAAALEFCHGVAIDAACASSLYALKNCCDMLKSGELDLALAGGVALPDSLFTQMGFSQLGALSKKGVSRPFDERGDGLLVGQGGGLFALKRLGDAIREGDEILGVIAGCGVSSDLEGGLLAPSSEGQWRAMGMAFQDAGIGGSIPCVDYFECHATGTPLGDSVEVSSLAKLHSSLNVARSGCVLGSVKGTVGHMLTAAGAAGLIRLLLAMRQGVIPPTAGFTNASPSLGLEGSPFQVLTEAKAWPLASDGPRRAGISGFGFGGINAHLVVEQFHEAYHGGESAGVTPSRGDVVVCGGANMVGYNGDPNAPQRFPAVKVPLGRYKIPPKSLQEILPQQLWVLEAAFQAMEDAGLPLEPRPKGGVFVGIDLDPGANQYSRRWQAISQGKELQGFGPPLTADGVMGSLGGIVGSRVARELQFGGCGYTVSAGDQSGLVALRLAIEEVRCGRLEVAVVAAIGDASHPLAEAYVRERGFGYTVCRDGVVAMVVTSREKAQQWRSPIYTRIENIGRASGGSLSAEEVYYGAASGLMRFWQGLYDGASSPMRVAGEQWDYEVEHKGLLREPPPRVSEPKKPYIEVASPFVEPSAEWPHGLEPSPLKVFRKISPTSGYTRPSVGGDQGYSTANERAAVAGSDKWKELYIESQLAMGRAHEGYLSFVEKSQDVVAKLSGMAPMVWGASEIPADKIRATRIKMPVEDFTLENSPPPTKTVVLTPKGRTPFNNEPAFMDYEACETFAVGKIGDVLGPDFAPVDNYPTRVRLPEGPLLLCHRIMEVEGTPRGMGRGTLVTEHDIHSDAWYLDGGRIPPCISIESGQADLFLGAYLGVDFMTKGERVYRLLDAAVTFHSPLPGPGKTIRYDIRIENFFYQGKTPLFKFGFEATVDGAPLMSMSNGCAGFFSQEDLANGRGVVKTPLMLAPMEGKLTGGFEWPSPRPLAIESYDEMSLDALRQGHLADCFGEGFSDVGLTSPGGIPGGMMRLVHRITELDIAGGRFGIGKIVGEADIHPDDWFITCHFVDDMVMPGTLMYECCLHTLRVFLLRLGWVAEAQDTLWEPVEGVSSQLKCRGQVLGSTKKVGYEIVVKEMGYGPDAYVIADALMYADGKPIVDIANMSLKQRGLTREKVERMWAMTSGGAAFSQQQLLAFAQGNPSDCFGPAYGRFDAGKERCARLPRPPLLMMDFVDEVHGEPSVMATGSRVVSHYTVPLDAWYLEAEGGAKHLPYVMLLEIALQPCGFLAAYMGSALSTKEELFFRNLGGQGTLLAPVVGDDELRVVATTTNISQSAGMIIENFSFEVFREGACVFHGDTVFGFFTGDSLAKQVGLKEAHVDELPSNPPAFEGEYPASLEGCLPKPPLLMVDQIRGYWPDGGAAGLGRIQGVKLTDPTEWFFEAHFFQDPVMPGSLGLEALIQLGKFVGLQKSPDVQGFEVACHGKPHQWVYRGQVIPSSHEVLLDVEVTSWCTKTGRFSIKGLLLVDGLVIYKMGNFVIGLLV